MRWLASHRGACERLRCHAASADELRAAVLCAMEGQNVLWSSWGRHSKGARTNNKPKDQEHHPAAADAQRRRTARSRHSIDLAPTNAMASSILPALSTCCNRQHKGAGFGKGATLRRRLPALWATRNSWLGTLTQPHLAGSIDTAQTHRMSHRDSKPSWEGEAQYTGAQLPCQRECRDRTGASAVHGSSGRARKEQGVLLFRGIGRVRNACHRAGHAVQS